MDVGVVTTSPLTPPMLQPPQKQFDTDDDGKLTAAEITRALVSRGVAATEEVVQMFIEGERLARNFSCPVLKFMLDLLLPELRPPVGAEVLEPSAFLHTTSLNLVPLTVT